MSEAPDDDPMMDLFRAEVRDLIPALSRGLLSYESAPDDPLPVGEMAEAVRGVRGAARLVGLGSVADTLSDLDAYLTADRAPDADWTGPVHDAVTLLANLEAGDPAGWVSEHAAELTALRDRLNRPSAEPAEEGPSAEPAEEGPVASEIVEVETPAIVTGGPAPAPAVPPALRIAVDSGLLELFREEVRSHAAALSADLLELERDPTNPQRIEPLMRAAHSLKGACRIVGLDPAVELAHDLEDVFVAAQAGAVKLTPAAIDQFLAVADVLAALGETDPNDWITRHAGQVAGLRTAITAAARGEAVPPSAPETAVAAPLPESPPTPTPPAEPPPPAPAANGSNGPNPPPPPAEAVVRVSADSLTRLMSLAGESLVQARWLQPFASALLELRKVQDQIAARLDTAASAFRDHGRADDLDDLRRLGKRCQQILADRIGEFETHAGQAEDLNTRLYREVIVSRMRPFADGLHGFPRLVRDTAKQVGKPARLVVEGKTTEVDRDILEKLEAPLTHLLRNAVDHGIEPPGDRAAAGKPAEGTVKVEARHRGGMLSITVADDGAGIDVERLRAKVVDRGHATPGMAAQMTDAELLEFLFLPGFSTAAKVTEVSGRGVGLDVVQDTVRAVGGSVQIKTKVGAGTTFHLMLPITLSVVRAVLIEVAGELYAFPHNRIDRLLRANADALESLQHRQFMSVDGKSVGLVMAAQLFDVPIQAPPTGGELPVVLLSDASGTYGLIVDAFRGEQDLVVRPLDPRLGKVPNVGAAAILDDGSPVLIADAEDLIRSMDQYIQSGTLRRFDPGAHRATAKKRVLVVDDSITVREVQRQILKGRGYDVDVAVDGMDGWGKLHAGGYDLVVSDVDMPRMTGLDLVRKIRGDAKLKGLPVVIVSYKDRDEDRLRGMEAGADHYLVKSSFHDDSFVDIIGGLIGQ